MKKFIIVIAFGLILGVSGQTEKSNKLSIEQQALKLTAKMKKSLSLNESQVLLLNEMNLKMLKDKEDSNLEINNIKKALLEAQKKIKEIDKG